MSQLVRLRAIGDLDPAVLHLLHAVRGLYAQMVRIFAERPGEEQRPVDGVGSKISHHRIGATLGQRDIVWG